MAKYIPAFVRSVLNLAGPVKASRRKTKGSRSMNPAEVRELREVLSAGAYVGVFDGTHLRFDENTPAVQIGQPGDQVVMGDWNNDGRETPGIFRSGNWILDITGNGIDESDKRISFGWATDKPVAGDWDGNGYVSVHQNHN